MLKELYFPGHFHFENRQKLVNKIEDNSVIFIMSALEKSMSHDTNYSFRQDSNFFYYTGLELKRTVLAISKINGKIHEVLFRKLLDPALERWVGANVSEEEIVKVSGIEDIRALNDLDDYYSDVFGHASVDRVYLYNEPHEGMVVPSYTQMFAHLIKSRFPFINIKALNKIVEEQRMIKQQSEIKMIRRAIEITAIGLRQTAKAMEPKIKEREVEALLTYHYLRQGADRHAFNPIAATGINATVMHYEANNCVAGNHDLLLIDTGAAYKNYAADITRTFPVAKKFSENQKKYYNIVLEARKEVFKLIKPGVKISDLQARTKEVLFEGLKNLKMLKKIEELGKYYCHGIGHHLGIDVHDVSDSRAVLQKNMIITIEPGLYIEDKAIGIRLEDDILIRDNGFENLSKDIPIEIEEVEALCAGKV